MRLTPKGQERFAVFAAAKVARRHKEHGIPLDHPETAAYVINWCIERSRDGQSAAGICFKAPQLLDREDVMDGASGMIDMIRVRPMFPDGTRLVTAHDPIRSDSVSTADSTADAITDGDNTDSINTSGGDDA